MDRRKRKTGATRVNFVKEIYEEGAAADLLSPFRRHERKRSFI
jgi:hypothetical protein